MSRSASIDHCRSQRVPCQCVPRASGVEHPPTRWPFRQWAAAATLLLTIVGGCTMGVTETPYRPLVGGTYEYTSNFLGETGAIFRGRLLLQDGADGAIGGSYALPNQCVREETTVDCRGFIEGTQGEDRTITFDFDMAAFRHTGHIERDGTLRGLWTLTLPADTLGPARVLSGSFTAVPRR